MPVLWGLSSCGGSSTSSSGGSSSVELATLSDLPKATGPVDSSSSSSLKKSMKAATVGMGLRDTSEESFDSNSSLAACEMFNQTKSAIQNAAQGDLILCYVQQIFEAASTAGLTNSSGSAIDIYDGNEHIFDLVLGNSVGAEDEEEGEDHTPDHIKFQITKSGDTITDFTMRACKNGEMMDYLNQSISGSTFSMIEKGIEGSTMSHSTEVSGTLASNGHFTGTKTIAMSFWGSFDGNEQWGTMSFLQGSDSATMTGYMNGSFSDGSVTGTFTNQVVGSVELLDSNSTSGDYDIGLLALGDGAVSGGFSGNMGSETWTDTFTEGWNGDTLLVDEAAAADYLTDVASASLPSGTEPSISYTSSEDYDCNGTPEATIVAADLSTLDISACSNLEVSHSWINCWDLTGGGE